MCLNIHKKLAGTITKFAFKKIYFFKYVNFLFYSNRNKFAVKI